MSVRAHLPQSMWLTQREDIETSFSFCSRKTQKHEQTHKSDGRTISCFNGTLQLHTWLHRRRLLIRGGTLILEAQLLDSFYVSSIVDDFGPPDWLFRAIRRTFFNELIQLRVPPRRQSGSFLEFPLDSASRCRYAAISRHYPPRGSSIPRFLDSSTPRP